MDLLSERRFVHVYPQLRVRFGEGEAERLAASLERLGIERGLLLSGPTIARNTALIESINSGAEGRIVEHFSEIERHTPIPQVEAAALCYRTSNCDGVISLGGGSTHDAARALGLCIASSRPLLEHFDLAAGQLFRNYADTAIPGIPPILALPSTLSAAETTFGGGITDPVSERKYVVVGHAMYVDEIVCDPAVFRTTPLDVLLSTGMNAVNHALERLCSPVLQPVAEPMLTGALRLLLPALVELAHSQGEDAEALSRAIIGAHISESVNVMSGIGHALAHQLGGRFRIEHGILNGIVMSACLEFVEPAVPNQVAALQSMLGDLRTDADISHLWLPGFLRRFVADVGLPTRLRDVGVPRDELPAVAVAVLGDVSTPHSARPVEGADEVLALLESCW